MTNDRVFEAFLGRYEELKTFFYGHSYCANPLGRAAAMGSLRVFEEENVLASLTDKVAAFSRAVRGGGTVAASGGGAPARNDGRSGFDRCEDRRALD